MAKSNPTLGTVLVILGTGLLFCAGIVSPIVWVDANIDGRSARDFPPLVEAIAVAALIGLPGAALVAYGQPLRNAEPLQASLSRFAGNLLIALGITWMAVTGTCAIPLSHTSAIGMQLMDASLFVIGAVICIIGLALRRSDPR